MNCNIILYIKAYLQDNFANAFQNITSIQKCSYNSEEVK